MPPKKLSTKPKHDPWRLDVWVPDDWLSKKDLNNREKLVKRAGEEILKIHREGGHPIETLPTETLQHHVRRILYELRESKAEREQEHQEFRQAIPKIIENARKATLKKGASNAAKARHAKAIPLWEHVCKEFEKLNKPGRRRSIHWIARTITANLPPYLPQVKVETVYHWLLKYSKEHPQG